MMPRKTGVLLMNTGTPADPSVEAIRTHLAEFLSDPMLISAPPFIWKRVLKYVILPKRPERTAVMYKKMWTDEGFPFMIHSRNQRDLIEAELKARNYNDGDFEVVLAMRYGEPSIWHGLEALRKAGCERIVAVPLYPQQVRVCAGTCFKEVADRLKDMEVDRWSPELVEVPNFYRQPVYLEALAKSIADVWEYKPGSHLLLSWHSTPMADINIKGDPYRVQNFYTAQRVAHALAHLAGQADDVFNLFLVFFVQLAHRLCEGNNSNNSGGRESGSGKNRSPVHRFLFFFYRPICFVQKKI